MEFMWSSKIFKRYFGYPSFFFLPIMFVFIYHQPHVIGNKDFIYLFLIILATLNSLFISQGSMRLDKCIHICLKRRKTNMHKKLIKKIWNTEDTGYVIVICQILFDISLFLIFLLLGFLLKESYLLLIWLSAIHFCLDILRIFIIKYFKK